MMIISGGSGRLGTALRHVFPQAVYPSRTSLDVLEQSSVVAFLEQHQPDVFVHTAAMTDVRLAESEQERCWDTNVRGVERIVNALATLAPDCYFVYVSTACVFQGDRGNYLEDDVPNPKNFYGLTKLVGEYVARRMRNNLIIRTNFVACEPWPYPRAFSDRFGTYLFADDVAKGISDVVQARYQGTLHLAGSERMSMYDLAKLTSPSIGSMTMSEVTVPLTVDMTLRSKLLDPIKIGSVTR